MVKRPARFTPKVLTEQHLDVIRAVTSVEAECEKSRD
jgi:hypothetical protein